MTMKTCTQCGKQFTPSRPLQPVCGMRCAIRKVNAAKQAKKALERSTTRERKEALKTIADRIAEVQFVFNKFIRTRDQNLGCIDCGKPFEPQKPGGSMDAGHYRSRTAAPELRFSEDAVFGQRKNCNRPGGAKSADFRAGMVARIGEERVRAVETDTRPLKRTHESLIDLKAEYVAKLKALLEEQDPTEPSPPPYRSAEMVESLLANPNERPQ